MDNIIIEGNDLELAQTLCSAISETDSRNRAVANVVGARIASKYFNTDVYDVDTDTALHNVAIINQAYDISDIYINNAYVDVRVYFSAEELCVPKSHFEKDILPAAYMFIKLNQDLSQGSVAGFILPNNIDKTKEKNGFYYLEESDLCTLYNIESHFKNEPNTAEVSKENIYAYIEGMMEENEQNRLIKTLISSKTTRRDFIKIIKAQFVLNMISSKEFPAEAGDSVIPENDIDSLYGDDNGSAGEGIDASILEELEYSTSVTPSGAEVIDSLDEEAKEKEENSEQIDTLFTGEQKSVPVGKNKGSGSFIAALVFILIICAGGYWWYTNMYSQNNNDLADIQEPLPAISDENIEPLPVEQPAENAMPIETVNNVPSQEAAEKEAGNSVEIPAIEQNLDATVLVSNLKVDWEVPAGYVSNTAARRYLVKLGKIIQLNLKSELLLLTKPPIANKITVELTFDPNINRFEVVGIQNSSGEKTVDATILETVKSALKMSISSNFESFGKLQGNPVLVIHL